MFHGILWLSAHEEKKPLTTAAATRWSRAAVNKRDGAAVGEPDHADPLGVDQGMLAQDDRGSAARSHTFWARGFQPAMTAWTRLVSQA